MRALAFHSLLALLLLANPSLAQSPAPTAPPPAPAAPAAERLAADTPKTTVLGNTFIAPMGWTVSVRGAATILEAPEGDSFTGLPRQDMEWLFELELGAAYDRAAEPRRGRDGLRLRRVEERDGLA